MCSHFWRFATIFSFHISFVLEDLVSGLRSLAFEVVKRQAAAVVDVPPIPRRPQAPRNATRCERAKRVEPDKTTRDSGLATRDGFSLVWAICEGWVGWSWLRLRRSIFEPEVSARNQGLHEDRLDPSRGSTEMNIGDFQGARHRPVDWG